MSLNEISKEMHEENVNEYLTYCQKNGIDSTNYESTITLPKQRRK